jgi:exopolysaccharide biosynthesis polyprenyl glycosylphosphotransferase
MKKFDRYKRIIMFAANLIIVLLQVIVFWIAWHDFYNKMIIFPFFRRGSWLMVAIYTLLLITFLKIFGGYHVGYYKKTDVIFSQILSMLCVNGITYLQISLLGLGFLNIIPLIGMTCINIFIIVLWTLITDTTFKKIYPPRRMILLYGHRSPDSIITKMGTRKDKYNICAAMNVDIGYNAVITELHKYEAVIIWDIPSEIRNPILKYCFGNSIRTYVMPKLSDVIIMRSDNINLFDTPLLLSRNFGLTFDQSVIKRIFDILFSLIAIIITSPVMLVIAIVIKLYDHGSVFYKQDRLTIDGKIFQIIKFRSMIVDAEKDGVARLAGEKDDRITPIGKFLRATRLDELPQFFNIFMGHMAVVGPRPERPEIANEYLKEMPEFDYRLKVKAGLTGYAQVYGYYNTTPYDKLKLDISYIESYSIWLDIKLIMLTAKILFRKESTQGIIEGQVTAQQIYSTESELASALDISSSSMECYDNKIAK